MVEVAGGNDLPSSEFGLEWGFGVVYDLSFNRDVFVLFNFSFLSYVLNLFFRDILRNILPQVFDGIIVSDSYFSWNFFDSSLFSVLCDFSGSWDSLDSSFLSVIDDFFLEWHIFDSAFSLDDFSTGVNNGIDDMGGILVNVVVNMSGNMVINVVSGIGGGGGKNR